MFVELVVAGVGGPIVEGNGRGAFLSPRIIFRSTACSGRGKGHPIQHTVYLIFLRNVSKGAYLLFAFGVADVYGEEIYIYIYVGHY